MNKIKKTFVAVLTLLFLIACNPNNPNNSIKKLLLKFTQEELKEEIKVEQKEKITKQLKEELKANVEEILKEELKANFKKELEDTRNNNVFF